MFTERAREAIAQAQNEAREMGHGSVEVEHLLLGLFSDSDGVAGRVFADFGLAVEPVRELARTRLDRAGGSLPEGRLSFSAEAKEVLRSANRFGMGAPGTAHVLIVIARRGEGGACEILRQLGADPHQMRFAAKKLAWPSSFPEGAPHEPAVRLIGSVRGGIPELEFGD